MATPHNRRVLAIGLDGLEISYVEKLMEAGHLPALQAFKERCATFLLDHGSAQRTGLAWEHVASGLSPKDANRWSAVNFDPQTYATQQQGACFTPFLEALDARTVVFDAPYCDLSKTTKVEGIVGWGAHDPGTALSAYPRHLYQKFKQRFGNYPSPDWIYACPAYSIERCKQMGAALVKALEVRRQAALWLFEQKRQDCDLFYVVTGEIHSAIEGLWHGVDPAHPLHDHPSAPAAAASLLEIHQALDRFVGDLLAAADNTNTVAFSMGGMGSNESDLQSMVLLPELLYRYSFKKSRMRLPGQWTDSPGRVPHLPDGMTWDESKRQWFTETSSPVLAWLQKKFNPFSQSAVVWQPSNLSWHPAMAYQSWWPQMTAFALPSFYDGRIRLNLRDREAQGIVPIEAYEETCASIEAMLRQCQDPRTGQSAVANVERSSVTDPFLLDKSDADMTVVWQGSSNGFEHPEYGLIGPIPFRRTGGHTGPYGVAFIAAKGLPAGFRGVRSSFDVVPTIADLLKTQLSTSVSGTSLLTSLLS